MALGKKKIAIIAGVSAAVLVTALGVGLGVGLSSSTTVDEGEMYLDPISGETRSERDLLNNDITVDGKTYDVIKEGDKLFAVVAKDERLELTQPMFNYYVNYPIEQTAGGTNYAETIKLPLPSEWSTTPITTTPEFNIYVIEYKRILSFGEDYFYTMVFGNIGHVKILNDGYIWGGFVYNSDTEKIEKHEALTSGPLKFGTIYPDGHALIDLAVVHEYQIALKEYEDATTDADKNTAAGRMRNADSEEGKTNRDTKQFVWKITHYNGKARVYTRYNSDSVSKIPVNPETTGTGDIAYARPIFVTNVNTNDNPPSVNENGKFSVADLQCTENKRGYWIQPLYKDDNTKVCIEPDADENQLAEVNQGVNVELGDLNYQLFNFQGGHIKNPLLNKISTTSELTATPDGYVTLPGITDRVRVQEKTNYVVVPSDIKIELEKAMGS